LTWIEKLEESLRDYVRIKEAARLLGVSEATVRNWGRLGKIKTFRHPVNGYRLFKKSDLEELLTAVKHSAQPS
jgi:DNA (cytosine-5)-methyltransferase 1